jgi:hypothetical protein
MQRWDGSSDPPFSMPNHRNRFPARRRFLKQSTALTATVVALPLPQLARAGEADKETSAEGTSPQPEVSRRPASPLVRKRRDTKR